MMENADTVIVGGGFSGLLTAIHLKGLAPRHSVTVLEQEVYPLRYNALMILPPLARQLLKRVAPLGSYKFNEGRFLIFKIEVERDTVIETADTAVVNYLDFVQAFYRIALDMGVKVYLGNKVVRIDKRYKFAESHTGRKFGYGSVIEAAGAAASVKNERVLFSHAAVDQDIYCYPAQCAYTLETADANSVYKVVPSPDNLPKTHTGTIKIGDMNGYIDHFIDIHTRYTVISAISAAETVYGGKGAKNYYRSMENIAGDIRFSLLVRQLITGDISLIHTPDFPELLSSVLLFGTPYKKLFEYLKTKGGG